MENEINNINRKSNKKSLRFNPNLNFLYLFDFIKYLVDSSIFYSK